MAESEKVCKVCYSGVWVYELECNGIQVMLRRADQCLNATQILKVAGCGKAERSKILLADVQCGEHEIIQGGYGKYQGTWVPFERGVSLAEEYGVKDQLQPLLEYRFRETSPPLKTKFVIIRRKKRVPVLKRITRPILPKPVAVAKPISKPVLKPTRVKKHHDSSNRSSIRFPYSKPIKNISIWYSKVLNDEDEAILKSDLLKDIKRKAYYEIKYDKSYANRLLEYFMSYHSGICMLLLRPPTDFDINGAIDEEGNTALHYAASMGRISIMQIMFDNHVDIAKLNNKGQTALIRSVLSSDSYQAGIFHTMLILLESTIMIADKENRTLFHYIAIMMRSEEMEGAGKYYAQCILEKLSDSPAQLLLLLNKQDARNETALSIALKTGNKELVRLFVTAGASTEYIQDSFRRITNVAVLCSTTNYSS
ncbi:hypothetical protein BDB01DRAFT_845614 [Pilobolus umbonatus]|nr:hypothetical protein BDB01DRAFT_845614 [Pilobolus umbonatus]